VTVAAILPSEVSVVESFDVHARDLFPEEEVLVRFAKPRRRAEFATGRWCAHRALAALGVPAQPILYGSGREPIWPQQMMGSITHCEGYCAAAVARSQYNMWLGIDAEPNCPLPEGVIDRVASTKEMQNAARRSPDIQNWDRLLFSAKESIYKAWYPIRKTWLDFKDISIILEPLSCSFTVIFTSCELNWFENRQVTFKGRYSLSYSHIFTSVIVSPVMECPERR
jgi:4'-phosphopantetheinyl transferase EntD